MTIQIAEQRSYEIEGQTVTMPLVVGRADIGVATFLVSASKAQELLPGPELDVVELLPGRALLTISCVDYIETDLGRYNERNVTQGTPPALPVEKSPPVDSESDRHRPPRKRDGYERLKPRERGAFILE